MQYFSNLFDKYLYLLIYTYFGHVHSPSSGVSQHCIHALGICHASCVDCLLAWSVDHASTRQQNQHYKYLLRVYSVEILLMMDSGHGRNMRSTLSNKYEKHSISLAFIIRTQRRTFTFVLQSYSYILNLSMAYMTSKPLRKLKNKTENVYFSIQGFSSFISAKREFSDSDCGHNRKGAKCFSIRKSLKASFHLI